MLVKLQHIVQWKNQVCELWLFPSLHSLILQNEGVKILVLVPRLQSI